MKICGIVGLLLCIQDFLKFSSSDLDLWSMTLTLNKHHPQTMMHDPAEYEEDPLYGLAVLVYTPLEQNHCNIRAWLL